MKVFARLMRDNRTCFNLVGQGYEFDLGRVRNCDLDFFLIGYRGQRNVVWDDWAAPFLGSSTFVMAWLADLQYDFWQNAHDPLQYTARNGTFDHLPKKSNGLPYPLQQTINN